MDVDFCLEAVEEAIANYGAPAMMNTDQGSQFTSQRFTNLLKEQEIQISRMARVLGGTMSSLNVCGDP